MKYTEKRIVLAVMSALCAPAVFALPTAPTVINGAASFNQAGKVLTVTNSPGAIINWQKFSIQAGETTHFAQTSASSTVLNRVLNDPTAIYGTLSSNGRVWLVNPAGIMVGPGGRVDVAGFVASTLNIRNEDFLAGRNVFVNDGSAKNVINQGEIKTPAGGSVYLIGSNVSNEGIITTPKGETILAAGATVSLIDSATPGVKVDITGSEGNATNLGTITAEAGRIGIAGVIVRNSGTVNANSVVSEGGRVFLKATKKIELAETSKVGADGTAGGNVTAIVSENGKISGELVARGEISAQGNGQPGSGGFVETSAAKVQIDEGFRVNTGKGQWLIDPNDYTIAASGGDITGSLLSSQLGSNNITILSSSGSTAGNGDIFVDDAVSWTANTTLTLSAYRNIEVSSNITATGNTAGLTLTPATGGSGTYNLNNGAKITLSGGTPKLNIAGHSYVVVKDVNALQAMNGNLLGYYALGSDIDASATSGWNGGSGFVPIGNNTTAFIGAFDGLGHSIKNLYVNRPSTDYVGLIGYLERGSTVQNVDLLGGSVNGLNKVGALAGSNSGKVMFSSSSTQVTGSTFVGGLVGSNIGGDIVSSHTSGSVTGTGPGKGIHVGGLAGSSQFEYIYHSNIRSSYSTGNVSGQSQVGGLVGLNADLIENSYASGNVNGLFGIGGLVGVESVVSVIRNSYATGNTNGKNDIGGLVGYTEGDSWNILISNTYATGNVSGSDNVGGLVGRLSGTVTNSYATGQVSGTTKVGGLVGTSISSGGPGIVTNSYWDAQRSGQSTSAGGTGLTTAQMKQQAKFTGFDFSATPVWRIYEGHTAPLLASFLTPLIVTATADSKTYDGLTYTGGNGVTYSIASPLLSGSLTYSGTSQNAINAGSYVIAPSGYYSNQQGYDISYVDSLLTINKAPLSVTANAASKTYDGLAYGGGNGVSYTGFVNGEGSGVFGGTLAYGGSSQGAMNAGSYAITPSGLTSGNYNLTFNNGTLTIGKANATVTANSASTTYNGLSQSVSGFTATGLVNGELATVLTGVSANGSGTNAGNYSVVATGTDGNYNLTFNNGTLTIQQRPISILADDKTKLVKAPDPKLTYEIGGMGLVTGDTLTGNLTRESGEAVGAYPILQGTLVASSNYSITDYLGASLSIIQPKNNNDAERISAINTASENLITASENAINHSPVLEPVGSDLIPTDKKSRGDSDDRGHSGSNERSDSARDEHVTQNDLGKEKRSKKPGEVIAVIR